MKAHFVRDYNKLVKRLVATETSYDDAMAQAVGGDYDAVGRSERQMLELIGLRDGHHLIDIGAGSGRLANALRDLPSLSYLGTDVVQELLDFAARKVARPDWAFKPVEKIEIPAEDGVADFVVFFSVLTHLTETESFTYLREARRVLKADGAIVVSYLDRAIGHHQRLAGGWLTQQKSRLFGQGVRNILLDKPTLERWAKTLGCSITYPYEAVEAGQSVCVFRPG